MLASHALALVGVPMRRVIRVVQDQRDARYGLLRGYFHGSDDDSVHDVDQTRLSTLCLLYTSDAADERSSVDLGGRRIIKKKKHRRRQCCGRDAGKT